MSLSDFIRRQRALHGGVTPNEIEAATGIPSAEVRYMEVKYRRVGDDDEALTKLAEYFGVPPEELIQRRDYPRKKLTAFLAERVGQPTIIRLRLSGGPVFVGSVIWNDRQAIGLRLDDDSGEVIVYRHAVEEWGDFARSASSSRYARP